MKGFRAVLVVLALVASLVMAFYKAPVGHKIQRSPVTDNISADERIVQAYERRESGIQVEVVAPVIKVLTDDNDGSRHQRFLIRLSSGQTVFISHNIDLAPRIENLKAGDTVVVYGQYEWNERGGVIHWTHRDPMGRHVDGWIEHNGRRYQ